MMTQYRLGRYSIKKYDARLVAKMKSLSRHIYGTEERNGKRVVFEFDHNPIPSEIIITDKKLGLTSTEDRMSWEVFLSTGYIKDNTIAW